MALRVVDRGRCRMRRGTLEILKYLPRTPLACRSLWAGAAPHAREDHKVLTSEV